LALLASRRAPAHFKGVVKTREYCAGVVEEGPASVGQLNATRLAAKQLYIKFALDSLDALTERRLLHAEPLGSPRDVFFLGDRDEISEMPQLHCHIQNV